MERVEFRIRSRSEPDVLYDIVFVREAKMIAATCTCPAGRYGGYCKHRLALLEGKNNGIVSDNADQVVEIASWLKDSNLDEFIKQVNSAELELAIAKEKLSAAKKSLSTAMNGKR